MQPKILVFDVETAPITAYVWGLFDQNIGLNQIKDDWHMLSWAAKWLGDPPSKIIYMDNSKAKDIRDDKALVAGFAKLLNQADVIITQNGDKFDMKKLRARAIINGLPPFRPCKSTDLYKESKMFAFTSHKLEYMAEKLNHKYKKLRHKNYPGFSLWSAILAGDKQAWRDMQTYNKYDVLVTDELYTKMFAWIKTPDVSIYKDGAAVECRCGSDKLESRGYSYTTAGKYQRYQCRACHKWLKSSVNLLSLEKRKSLMKEGK